MSAHPPSPETCLLHRRKIEAQRGLLRWGEVVASIVGDGLLRDHRGAPAFSFASEQSVDQLGRGIEWFVQLVKDASWAAEEQGCSKGSGSCTSQAAGEFSPPKLERLLLLSSETGCCGITGERQRSVFPASSPLINWAGESTGLSNWARMLVGLPGSKGFQRGRGAFSSQAAGELHITSCRGAFSSQAAGELHLTSCRGASPHKLSGS
ncbi:hypothetical protein Droror1_Dr00016144 [Drosera rotundifolia]